MSTLVNNMDALWYVTRSVKIAKGLSLGLMQYIYFVFLYDHFGGNSQALRLIVVLMIVSSISILVLEIPTGAIGDYFGRKKTIVASFFIAGVAYTFRVWLCFIPDVTISFSIALATTILMSLSTTLFSGTFIAWLVDSVRLRCSEHGHGALLSRAYGSMIVSKLIGAAIGLALYLSDFMYFAIAVAGIVNIVAAFYCGVVMSDVKSVRDGQTEDTWNKVADKVKQIIKVGIQVNLKVKPVFYLMVMYASFMTLIYVVVFLWAIAMKSNFGVGKMSYAWYLIAGLSFLTSFFGAKLLEWLHHRSVSVFGKRMTNADLWLWVVAVCLCIALSVLVLGGASLVSQMSLGLFVITVAIVNVGYGFLQPAYDTILNHYIPAEHALERATIMSVSSMVLELVMAVFLFPSSGPSGSETVVGWMIPAGTLFVVTFIMHFLMRRYQKLIGEIPPTCEMPQSESVVEAKT